MQSDIAVFTTQAISGIQQARILASRTSQKVIRGDDLFFGICRLMKQEDLRDIMEMLLHIPHGSLWNDRMTSHYQLATQQIHVREEKELPLSSKLSKAIKTTLAQGSKKLDLGVLFYISFSDLSSPCVGALRQA